MLNEIEKIKSLDLFSENSYSIISDILSQFRNKWPIMLTTTKVKTDANTQSFLYRCRVNECELRFTKVSQIIYPPDNKVSFGRANKKGQSVFYCSDTGATCYMELLEGLIKTGRKNAILTLSEWAINKEFEAATIVIPKKEDRKNNRENQRGDYFDEWLLKMPHDNSLYYSLTEFASKILRTNKKHDYDYILTSALSNFLTSQKNSRGLIYPSVPYKDNEQRGFNYALDKELISDDTLCINSITEIEVELNYTFSKCSFSIKNGKKAKSFSLKEDFIRW